MSEVIGFELKPQMDTSLSQMIEYGLSKHLDRLAMFTSVTDEPVISYRLAFPSLLTCLTSTVDSSQNPLQYMIRYGRLTCAQKLTIWPA